MQAWRNALIGSSLLATSVTIVGGALWLAVENREPIRDNDSMCALSVEYGQTVVFVDKTDPWNDAQANRLEQQIWWLVSDKMKTEERLSIFTINGQVEPGFPSLFSFCKPPSGETANGITRSRDYYFRQYKRQFADPLQEVLDKLKTAQDQDCSPIMETVFEVLTRREIRDHPGPTRIVLISDLAENSSLYSFYLNNKCFKRPPNSDPRWNTGRIEKFIKDRVGEINTQNMSAVVIQVFPEQSPPQLADWTKYTWTQFFRYINVPVEWERL